MTTLDSFFQKFIRPLTGTSPQDLLSKAHHLIDVVNDPAQYAVDTSPFALRAARRSARQSLRRLMLKRPEVLKQIMAAKNEAAQ
jgi:hypothetical protein